MTRLRLFTILAVCACSTLTFADDWPRFRGPNGSGIASGQKTPPTKWSPDSIKWKAEIKGKGVSSPIVVGNKVLVTSFSGYGEDRRNPGNMNNLKRHITCWDKNSGKQLWSKSVEPVLPEEPFSGAGIPAHGYASHTPVSDGKNVYAFFGRTGVVAFSLEGEKLWQSSVGKGDSPRRWGSASSPIVFEDLVIVPATAESSAMVALYKKDGKEAWKQVADGFYSSWSTPVISKVDDERTDLVIGVPYELWGLNPRNGKLRWYAEVIQSEQFNSSVVEHKGKIYAIEGRRGGGGGVAVKAGGKGNAGKSTLWSKNENGSFSSPLVHNGLIFHFAGGSIKCLDAESGSEVYQERLPRASGNSSGRRGGSEYSSPVAAGEHLYFVQPNGNTVVIKMGKKYEQVAVNKTTEDGETFSGTPAISDGSIFIRSDAKLYCIGKKSE